MRKARLLFIAVALCLAAPLAAQTVDEVIAKHLDAQGGVAKLKAIQSIRMTGRMSLGQGLEAPITIEVKRPKQMRMEFTFQGMTGVQAYDGTQGWQVMPFMGKKDPEPMSSDDIKDAEEQADIDGPLMDYKSKGNQVELLGKESVEGADCFKLKLTKKSGDVSYLYIDSESYLQVKMEGKRMIRGTEMEIETSIGDYKQVEGMMFPHAIEAGAKGSPQRQKISVDKIEINPSIDDSRFKMPEVKPAEPKPPVGSAL
jgi:outer membrane lipoprotein-sorting protein